MRTIVRIIVITAAAALVLRLLDLLLDGLSIEGRGTALAAGFALCLANALVWPVLARLTLPISVLTLGLASIVLNAAMTLVVLQFVDGVQIEGLWTAAMVTIGMSIGGVVVASLLTIDDDAVFDERMVRQMRRRITEPDGEAMGTVFIQIDGLALDVLRHALHSGDVPFLSRWVRAGSHRLLPWVTEWSSQTGVSQAGLLLGSTDDMPAFRWYEKQGATTVVSNRPASAALIESRRLADGGGLLADDGASYGNLYSGGAQRAALTMSIVGKRKGRFGEGYGPYLSHPRNLVRTTLSALGDVGRERRASREQHRRDVEPRITRSISYAFMRSFTTVVMRDVCVHAVIGAMAEGRRRIYVDLLGYDEVAHHSGVERHDAMQVLRGIDRQIGRIDRTRSWVKRPYQLVVLSDHGQSQGATFLGRYGVTLEDVVRTACALAPAPDEAAGTLTESRGYIDSALAPSSSGSGLSAKVASSAHRKITADTDTDTDLATPAASADPVVMASGNLGLIYFPDIVGRATLEDLEERHPALVDTLRAHPGIGFVLVATRDDGSVVLGPRGQRWLRRDDATAVEGDDPLAPFGPYALDVVRRADRFTTVADIMVNSFYDEAADEVAAFEELVGSHGGLGGAQSRPFLLVPADWAPPITALLSATEVHHYLVGQLTRTRS